MSLYNDVIRLKEPIRAQTEKNGNSGCIENAKSVWLGGNIVYLDLLPLYAIISQKNKRNPYKSIMITNNPLNRIVEMNQPLPVSVGDPGSAKVFRGRSHEGPHPQGVRYGIRQPLRISAPKTMGFSTKLSGTNSTHRTEKVR